MLKSDYPDQLGPGRAKTAAAKATMPKKPSAKQSWSSPKSARKPQAGKVRSY